MEINPAYEILRYFNSGKTIPKEDYSRRKLLYTAYPEGKINGKPIESIPTPQIYMICKSLERTAQKTVKGYEEEIVNFLSIEKASKSLDDMVEAEQEELQRLEILRDGDL